MNNRMKHLVTTLVGAVLLTAATIGTAQAQSDRRVWVTNNSSSSVWRLHYSSPGRDWGPDRLGDRTIPAGRETRFNVVDAGSNCTMDMKAVMRNGEEHKRFGVDVCSVFRWNLYNGYSDFEYAD